MGRWRAGYVGWLANDSVECCCSGVSVTRPPCSGTALPHGMAAISVGYRIKHTSTKPIIIHIAGGGRWSACRPTGHIHAGRRARLSPVMGLEEISNLPRFRNWEMLSKLCLSSGGRHGCCYICICNSSWLFSRLKCTYSISDGAASQSPLRELIAIIQTP